MPRECSVCQSPSRDAVDKAIVGGGSYRGVARRFNLGHDSVRRHADAHITPALKKVAAQRDTTHATTLLDRISAVIGDVEDIVATARERGAAGLQLQAIDRLEKMLRLLGSVTGELKGEGPAVVVNIATDPNWLRIRGILYEELWDHPELKARIATRLADGSEAVSLPVQPRGTLIEATAQPASAFTSDIG